MNPPSNPAKFATYIFPLSPAHCLHHLSGFRYALVWDDAAKLYQEMISAEGWLDQNEIVLPVTHDITSKVE